MSNLFHPLLTLIATATDRLLARSTSEAINKQPLLVVASLRAEKRFNWEPKIRGTQMIANHALTLEEAGNRSTLGGRNSQAHHRTTAVATDSEFRAPLV
ncbi:MAG: hypothetical protein GY903_04965 [Fuerstiella sp.]|nr:hypothetical protein [Fuerstiella sp.]MCP4853825.1 hypothetical protein [Fuerstiella sp.]